MKNYAIFPWVLVTIGLILSFFEGIRFFGLGIVLGFLLWLMVVMDTEYKIQKERQRLIQEKLNPGKAFTIPVTGPCHELWKVWRYL